MAQIQKGTTYGTTSPSNLVTSTNLNGHVDDAVLLPGAITDQTAKTVLASADTILAHSAADTALRKTTVAQVFASPQPIGSTTASTGAFTNLSASGTVSGTGFSSYLASPPSIGSTTPASGAFTSLSTTGQYKSAATAVAALNVDCSLGNYFTKTIGTNSTFTFSNVPTGVYAFALEVENTAGTISWPSSVKWPNDTAPTLSTGRTHLFVFITDDGGTRWRGTSNVNYVT